MRILLVEDEPAMAESLTWGLEAEGYGLDVGADDYLAKPFSYP